MQGLEQKNSAEFQGPARPHWGAVLSLSLGVVCVIIGEMLPAILLTPIASDLHVTNGAAGQAVTATSLVALVASLFTAVATRRFNRRAVVLTFSVLMALSNLLVAFAVNYSMLLAGRVLLGLALGGFWSMTPAVSLRLVPAPLVPRALAIIFGGVSAGMVAAVPVGSYLGGVIGWRGVFLGTAALTFAAVVWQFLTLPSIPPGVPSRLRTLIDLLKRPGIGFGMAGMMLVFGGHFAFFTYLRPFLEIVTGASASDVAIILATFGIANIVGTAVSGAMIRWSLRTSLAVMPLLMALLAAGLVVAGGSWLMAILLVAGWGFAFGVVPVTWTTWLMQSVPNETESGGGLQVAAIQLAIALGAGLGGVLLDATGPRGAFTGSGVILLFAACTIVFGMRSARVAYRPHATAPSRESAVYHVQ